MFRVRNYQLYYNPDLSFLWSIASEIILNNEKIKEKKKKSVDERTRDVFTLHKTHTYGRN